MIAYRHHMRAAMALGFLAAFVAAPAMAELKAQPANILFHAMSDKAVIALTVDGAPLPASDIKDIAFIASGHDYREMIQVEKADGQITVSPTDFLQVGSYDLRITAGAETVDVVAYAPLTELPGTLEKQAQELGISVDTLKERLGLTRPLGAVQLSFELPATYFEGQMLSLDLPSSPGHHMEWTVNGKVVKDGENAHKLDYVFEKAGPYVVTYVEYADGVAYASASADTAVVAHPPIPVDIKAGTTLKLQAPEGYPTVEWQIDDEIAATGPLFDKAIKQPTTVICVAKKPSGEFMNTQYDIRVTP